MKNVSHNINTLKCRDKALEKGEGAVRAPLTRARKKPRQQQEDRNKTPEALLRGGPSAKTCDRNRQTHGGKAEQGTCV